ncbi:MAG: hypothetical protein K0B02_01785 [DPANN group archaeon]|nr:hypothetical protein [DPANN group archaeon]
MKQILFLALLLFVSFINIDTAFAASASFDEYYFNPSTDECINHWRGNDYTKFPIPDNFYFSGYNDPNCTQLEFNLKEYNTCISLNGEYILKYNFYYKCFIYETKTIDIETDKLKKNIGSYLLKGVSFLFFILIVSIFIDRVNKHFI